jgi:hypothetical protein
MKTFGSFTIPAAASFAVLLCAACGQPQTSGFFVGATTGDSPGLDPGTVVVPDGIAGVEAAPTDTLVNCTFDDMFNTPFGSPSPYEVYHGAMHIDNSVFRNPVILLSTAGLIRDGLVEVQFDEVDLLDHSVIGLVLRAEGSDDFLLLGANSRGQYTVQKCINGLWFPVMGMEPLEKCRLLPYDLPGAVLTAEVHGCYVDFRVNGQLIQVVKTVLPQLGQIGVFVDAYASVSLDRFTVVPFP